MFFNKRSILTYLNCKIDISNVPTVRSAKLIHIKGKSALTIYSNSVQESKYDYRYLYQLRLNNIPLMQINSSEFPTCSSLLATGYGIENANCKEIQEIRDKINSPFVSLKDTIDNITPLLGLLDSGLYVVADAICYPTDGNGNFFWNTPNELVDNPATTGVYISDGTFSYVSGQSTYLYPTQSASCLNEERVAYYTELLKNGDKMPRAIVYNTGEFMNAILDGHHKACAASLAHKPVNCILIIPYSGMDYKHSKLKIKPNKLFFSGVTVSSDSVPKKYIKAYRDSKKKSQPFTISAGTINNLNWEYKYLCSANSYPTVNEYAVIANAGYLVEEVIEDSIIEECLNNQSHENIQKLKATLFLMIVQKDTRLKQLAMTCALKVSNDELQLQAYQCLLNIKNDMEIEQFLIDYLVECEDSHDKIRPIILSYWD